MRMKWLPLCWFTSHSCLSPASFHCRFPVDHAHTGFPQHPISNLGSDGDRYDPILLFSVFLASGRFNGWVSLRSCSKSRQSADSLRYGIRLVDEASRGTWATGQQDGQSCGVSSRSQGKRTRVLGPYRWCGEQWFGGGPGHGWDLRRGWTSRHPSLGEPPRSCRRRNHLERLGRTSGSDHRGSLCSHQSCRNSAIGRGRSAAQGVEAVRASLASGLEPHRGFFGIDP